MAGNEPREVGRKVIYDGRRVRLEVREIEEGGRRATREIVCHNGSVAVLALRRAAPGELDVMLERNYRHTLQGFCLEIPAGTLEAPAEDPLDRARSELAEETGYRASRWRKLLSIMPSPGFLTERLTIFVAESVEAGRPSPEAGELIEVVWVPWPEALAMVRRGEIEDAKTIAAILYYDTFLRGVD